MKRQAATSKGLKKRIRDMGCNQVTDPRKKEKTTYYLSAILTAIVTSLVTKARSLRQIEQRTCQIAKKHGQWLGIANRIADNTFSKILPRLNHTELAACLHRMVKAEHRRGNLKPTGLPFGTVAIDGKNVATLHWHDMCRAVGEDKTKATPKKVKALFAERYPEVQVCIPKEGLPYALIRAHTVTLISSSAGVCIHQRPIAGNTNEIGSMIPLLEELKAAYGRTRLFSMVTTDAGNTSVEVARRIRQYNCHYFCQIKEGHGDIYDETVRTLRHRPKARAKAEYGDKQNGQVVTYHVWQYGLSNIGWMNWMNARQLVRVQRTAEDPATGKKTVGNRFYVSSKTTEELSGRNALAVSRGHWRCEEETHWTADAEMMEDRRQLAWSRHPHGLLSVSVLRMAALFILAIARQLNRLSYSNERLSWGQVREHFLLQLCDGILECEAFDVV